MPLDNEYATVCRIFQEKFRILGNEKGVTVPDTFAVPADTISVPAINHAR